MSYVKGVLAIPGMTSKILVAVETSYAEPVHTRQGVEVLAKVKADAAALLQDLKRHFAFVKEENFCQLHQWQLWQQEDGVGNNTSAETSRGAT